MLNDPLGVPRYYKLEIDFGATRQPNLAHGRAASCT